MAIFNYLSNLDWNSYDDVTGGTAAVTTATTYRYTSATGFLVVLTGSGFSYDADRIPVAGTITTMQIYHAGVHYAAYTGLSYGLTDFALYGLGLQTGASTVLAPDSEALYAGLRAGSDVIHSNDLGKDISGYAGNDTIYGNAGDDWLNGGAGVDRFYGGLGVDGVYFSDVGVGGHGVHIDLSLTTGNIVDDGYGNVETASGVEKYDGSHYRDGLVGWWLDDSLWGEAGNDTLIGNAGNDVLFGGDGDDRIFGGSGNDEIVGGKGLDYYDGAAGNDTLAFWDVDTTGHGIYIDLSNTVNTVRDDGYGNVETVRNFEYFDGTSFGDRMIAFTNSVVFWGNGGGDSLYGGRGDDELYGGDGNDAFSGGDGDDTIEGGKGRDSAYGNGGSDLLAFWNVDASGHGVVVNLALGKWQVQDDGYGTADFASEFERLAGSAFGDNFSGRIWAEVFWGNDGNDTLNGMGGADTLYGGQGADSLVGGDGGDFLFSGTDNDTLVGGAGADFFYFVDDAPGLGVDLVVDMTHGVDKIVIDTNWSNALTGRTVLTADEFVSGSGRHLATTASQHLIYDTAYGRLYFDADGNGTTYEPEIIAVLQNRVALTYQDFVLTS